MSTHFEHKLAAYKLARDRANDWLLSLQNPDGSVGSPYEGAYYYRLPWTWAVTGKTDAAHQFVGWLREHMLADGGDLRGEYPLGEYAGHYTYLVANLVYGAHLLGDLDIAQSGVRVLMRYQDPISGAFSNANPDLTPSDWIEAWISAQAGLAFLMVGRIRVAEQVGNFLQLVFEVQPQLSQRLHFVYDRSSQRLVERSSERDEDAYAIYVDRPRQWFFVPGLISAFLVRLYQATNRSRYLSLSREYQDFVQGCSDKQFDGIEVCKTGWAAALLYEVTGDTRYRDWAIRVGDYFTDTQQEDGRWVDDRYSPSTLGQDIALTSQDILWIDAIAGALS